MGAPEDRLPPPGVAAWASRRIPRRARTATGRTSRRELLACPRRCSWPLSSPYAYPRLAELADLRGDHAFAAQLRDARRRAARRSCAREWTGKGWYSRGYNGTKQIGTGAIFGEPQPWAVLAGVPRPRRARTLVANIRRFLAGVGAPAGLGGPARIGSAKSPAERDPACHRAPPPAADLKSDGAAHVARRDLVRHQRLAHVGAGRPGRGRAGGGALRLGRVHAQHARRACRCLPRHWDGTISVDDACNAYYARSPARCGILLFDDYQGQITEQPTWMVMNAINLAGARATRAGFEIDPHLRGRFSLRFARVGVARGANALRGYLRVARRERLRLRVRVPAGVRHVRAWAAGQAVTSRRAGRFVTFTLPARPGRAADWAVTWR